MTVYVLDAPDSANGLNYLSAAQGFTLRGAEVVRFERGDFSSLPLTLGDVVVGGISLAHRAFEILGIAVPALDSVPVSLTPFAGRSVWSSSLGEVRRTVQGGGTVFAKPVPSRYKLFVGTAFLTVRDLIETADLADEEPVICADVLPFRSEYRCFVTDGDLLGVRHYKGDPLVFPDPVMIRHILSAHVGAPAGYALDVGITQDGQTCVVEVNDGYASGAYGLPPTLYARVIEARWKELSSERS